MIAKGRRQLGWERRQEILRYLRDHGSASVSTIAEVVDASPATIHRDLDHLAGRGQIERVHGGAVLNEGLDDPPTAVERHRNVQQKQMIAALALERIDDDVSSIFLEASTTVQLLVPGLRYLEDKVVVTNSPEIALGLVPGPCEVMLVGGNLRDRTLATVGPGAADSFAGISIDLCFIGVSAIDLSGVSSMNAIEAQTKSVFINGADRVIALADASKLGKRSLVPVSPLSSIEELITDASADKSEIESLRAAGLAVTVAPRARRLESALRN